MAGPGGEWRLLRSEQEQAAGVATVDLAVDLLQEFRHFLGDLFRGHAAGDVQPGGAQNVVALTLVVAYQLEAFRSRLEAERGGLDANGGLVVLGGHQAADVHIELAGGGPAMGHQVDGDYLLDCLVLGGLDGDVCWSVFHGGSLLARWLGFDVAIFPRAHVCQNRVFH